MYLDTEPGRMPENSFAHSFWGRDFEKRLKRGAIKTWFLNKILSSHFELYKQRQGCCVLSLFNYYHRQLQNIPNTICSYYCYLHLPKTWVWRALENPFRTGYNWNTCQLYIRWSSRHPQLLSVFRASFEAFEYIGVLVCLCKNYICKLYNIVQGSVLQSGLPSI